MQYEEACQLLEVPVTTDKSSVHAMVNTEM